MRKIISFVKKIFNRPKKNSWVDEKLQELEDAIRIRLVAEGLTGDELEEQVMLYKLAALLEILENLKK